jgi:hypothetical protein
MADRKASMIIWRGWFKHISRDGVGGKYFYLQKIDDIFALTLINTPFTAWLKWCSEIDFSKEVHFLSVSPLCNHSWLFGLAKQDC